MSLSRKLLLHLCGFRTHRAHHTWTYARIACHRGHWSLCFLASCTDPASTSPSHWLATEDLPGQAALRDMKLVTTCRVNCHVRTKLRISVLEVSCSGRLSLSCFTHSRQHGSHLAQTSRAMALVADPVRVQLHRDDTGTSRPHQDALAQRMFQARCKQIPLVFAELEPPMQWYTADWDYARTTVYCFCAGIVFFGLVNLFFRLGQQMWWDQSTYRSLPPDLSNPVLSVPCGRFSYTARSPRPRGLLIPSRSTSRLSTTTRLRSAPSSSSRDLWHSLHVSSQCIPMYMYEPLLHRS